MIVEGIDFDVTKPHQDTVEIVGWERHAYRPSVRGKLTRFPGSQQMWVSHDLYVNEDARGQGLSKKYHACLVELMGMHDIRAIVATVHVTNRIQHKRLLGLGWERLSNTLWIFRGTK